MEPRQGLRWMHQLSMLLSLAQTKVRDQDHQTLEQRRFAQRQRMLLALLADAELDLPAGEPRFWKVLRWGGAGFLAAQALHHLVSR